MNEPNGSPIVIVGTHRSGTSVTANSLRTLGLFTGARRDGNGESTFFQRLNRRLSSEAGGHWTNPLAVVESLSHIDDLPAFVEPLRTHLTGLSAIEYWGAHAVNRKPFPELWGWKDPRNGYLLPLWQTVYPELKVIWVRRDPRACAISMHRRAGTWRENSTQRAASSSLWAVGNSRCRLR